MVHESLTNEFVVLINNVYVVIIVQEQLKRHPGEKGRLSAVYPTPHGTEPDNFPRGSVLRGGKKDGMFSISVPDQFLVTFSQNEAPMLRDRRNRYFY